MSASDLWFQWLEWFWHDCRGPLAPCVAMVALIRQNRIDLQRGLGSLDRNFRTLRSFHGAFYPLPKSGTPTAASLDHPLHIPVPLDRDPVVMPPAPDVFLHWLTMSAPDYGGVIDTCLSTVDGIARHEVGQEMGLQILDQQLRRLSYFYSGIGFLGRKRYEPASVKEALFIAMELVQCPVDIEMSEDCEAQCAESLMPIILAMLLRTLHNNGGGDPFVEMSSISNGYRIFVAPNRTERGSGWSDISAQLDQSSRDWLAAVASELTGSGHSFTVRAKARLSTFLILYRARG